MDEALSTDQAVRWKEAADAEYQSLLDNYTWDLVKLPPGRKSIGCKWVFKVKPAKDGSIDKFKGRLVAKGFAQKYGVDYDETFSPCGQADIHTECNCPGSREDAPPPDGCSIGISQW